MTRAVRELGAKDYLARCLVLHAAAQVVPHLRVGPGQEHASKHHGGQTSHVNTCPFEIDAY